MDDQNWSNIDLEKNVYASCDGLVKEICVDILKKSLRPYPQFAMATAMNLIATVAQGTYEAPPLYRETGSKGALNLYTWLTAPAAAGKDFYLRYSSETIRAIDKRLICPRIGSYYGLRASLFSFNSRALIIDEMQDEMTRFSSKSNSYLSQVSTEFKELFNNLDELSEIAIKDRSYPAVKKPKLSIFGAGTTGGFQNHMTNNIIGGGLLSRFMVVPVIEVTNFKDEIAFSVSEKIVNKLAKIFSSGLTHESFDQNADDELQRFHSISNPTFKSKGEEILHIPQTMARWPILLSADAKMLLIGFREDQQTHYKQMVLDDEGQDEFSPASIVDRSAQLALKLASFHGLGMGRMTPKITLNDAIFGINFASWSTQWLVAQIRQHAVGTENERMRNRIHMYLKKNGRVLSKREMFKNVRGLDSRTADACLIDLAIEGRIECFEKGYDEPSSFAAGNLWPNGKVPYGCKFLGV